MCTLLSGQKLPEKYILVVKLTYNEILKSTERENVVGYRGYFFSLEYYLNLNNSDLPALWLNHTGWVIDISADFFLLGAASICITQGFLVLRVTDGYVSANISQNVLLSHNCTYITVFNVNKNKTDWFLHNYNKLKQCFHVFIMCQQKFVI